MKPLTQGISRIHQITIYTLNGAILFFALANSISQSGSEMSKVMLLVAALSVVVFERSIIDRFKQNKLVLLFFLLFFVLLCLSALVHANLQGNLTQVLAIFSQWALLPIILAVGHRIYWNVFFAFLLILISIQGYYLLSQYVLGFNLPFMVYFDVPHFNPGERVAGTFNSVMAASSLGIMGIMLSMSAYQMGWLSHKPKWNALWLFVICGIFFLIILPQVRGAWLALLIGIFCFGLTVMIAQKRILSPYLLFILLMLLLLVIRVNPMLYERIEESMMQTNWESLITDSLDFRYELLNTTQSMIIDNPLLGIGPGNYQQVLFEHTPTEKHAHLKRVFHAHNDFLHLCATAGIPTALALLAFIIGSFIKGIRFVYHNRYYPLAFLAVGVILLLLTLLIYGLSDVVIFGSLSGNIFWFFMGFLLFISSQTRQFEIHRFPAEVYNFVLPSDRKPQFNQVPGTLIKYGFLMFLAVSLFFAYHSIYYGKKHQEINDALFVKDMIGTHHTPQILLHARKSIKTLVQVDLYNANHSFICRESAFIELQAGESFLFEIQQCPIGQKEYVEISLPDRKQSQILYLAEWTKE